MKETVENFFPSHTQKTKLYNYNQNTFNMLQKLLLFNIDRIAGFMSRSTLYFLSKAAKSKMIQNCF